MSTWIVVAHRAGARLVDEHDDALRIFETIDFPEGRLPHGERGSDAGAAASDRRGSDARESARAHTATVFASQLATRLEEGRNEHRFAELVLIAAPRFLGALRQALSPATAAMVRGTLDKDFGGLADRDLLHRLERL